MREDISDERAREKIWMNTYARDFYRDVMEDISREEEEEENESRHRNSSGSRDERRDRYDDRNRRDYKRRSRSLRPRSSRSPRSPRRSASPSEKRPPPAYKPDFSNSGLLAAESKTVNGTVLKYHEPPEARKPNSADDWRLFVFSGEDQSDSLALDRQSCYLFGKDAAVADYHVAHASISKQHAVIQFRVIRSKNEFGDVSEQVKPFLLDLESTNGTQVNDKEIPVSRYYEIMTGDVIKFGLDKRDFVLIQGGASKV
ncbi:hypothetical protein E3P99_00219 [Wallemia hederae]|uniref:FHA domain-containing protein n=1 Tax=Wallemia hederae TaxID=1540922 RepID=A0A4T0FYL1_9BASI|nr:hypothetical protein E3P99_00219 [Wallemia hederae]